MKHNKNNTCNICNAHIDKSDLGSNWMTIIETKRVVLDDTEKGYHNQAGSRITLCRVCAHRVKMAILDAKQDEIEVKQK